jgi:hypothetical protein
LQAEVKGVITSVAKRDVPGVIRASYQGDIGYVAGLLLFLFNDITSYQKHHMSCASGPNIPPLTHTHTHNTQNAPFFRSFGDSPQMNQEQVDALLEFRDCHEVS